MSDSRPPIHIPRYDVTALEVSKQAGDNTREQDTIRHERYDLELAGTAEADDVMKKEKTKPEKPPVRKPVGEDATRLVTEITPGKKGGQFSLPFGGQIFIQPGTVGKKDVITCCMVSPSDRYKYLPALRSDEHLVSEIYLLASTAKFLKKPVCLKLPYYPESSTIFTLQLLMRRTDSEEWEKRDFKYATDEKYIDVDTEGTGIFVLTSCPKKERFTVPLQGCLYNAQLSHQISIRFPKKATETDILCEIQITKLNRQNLPNLHKEFPNDMADLVAASNYVDIRPSVQQEFRRPVTVKLPLPPLEQTGFPQEDMVVMQMTRDGWDLYDVPLKFTKTSVTFDTRQLSRYCVALSRPNRKRRLKEAFKHLDSEMNVTRGEILPFLHLQEKLWTLWFDCVSLDQIQSCTDLRLKQGFRQIKQNNFYLKDLLNQDKPTLIRQHWKAKKKVIDNRPKRDDIDIINGQAFDLQISGDIEICRDDIGANYLGLHYHQRLAENYRRFLIEPKQIEAGKVLTFFLKCFVNDPTIEGEDQQRCVRGYEADVDAEAVKAYFYIEPEPEPEPPPSKKPPVEVVIVDTDKPAAPPSPRQPVVRPTTASFVRLTTPTKPPRKAIKESKVLSGRSLMCLAREVEQGLTLAIHLDVSDSTITGMGFDALANGLHLMDITYRILLVWKRQTRSLRERQVDELAGALQEMGRTDVAAIILERHRQNLEITPQCFQLSD